MRAKLLAAAMIIGGATVGVASSVSLHPVSSEARTISRGIMTVNVGDTLYFQYAVRTDTVLTVGTVITSDGSRKGVVIAKACGTGVVFLRTSKYAGGAVLGTPLTGDTVLTYVKGCGTTPVPSPTQVAQPSSCWDPPPYRADTTVYAQYFPRCDTTKRLVSP